MSIHHEYVDIDTFLNKHIISKQPDDVLFNKLFNTFC